MNSDYTSLSDSDLIEAVATMMGFEFVKATNRNHRKAGYTIEVKQDEGGGFHSWMPWNPLKNWNHTMEVVERMESNRWFLEWRTIKQLDQSVEGGVFVQLAFMVFTNGVRQIIQKDPNRQRAICLAALQAVQ